MTKRCLDETVLQAYMDGELSPEKSAAAAAHAASCEACARALAEAAAESSFLASAFAPDEAILVPSDVLRSRIGAAVAQLESAGEQARPGREGRGLAGLFAPLAAMFNFTPQGAAAFATVVALVALGAVYFTSQRTRQTPDAPRVSQNEVARVEQATPQRESVTNHPSGNAEPTPAPTQESSAGVVPVNHKRATRRAARSNGGVRPKSSELPGEKEYQTAIASLEKTIKFGGDESLRPALRVEYERNLALLDGAITQTRHVAAQNPKDKDAVGFLMAAYQSKVELLTKVADQAQVAALGR